MVVQVRRVRDGWQRELTTVLEGKSASESELDADVGCSEMSVGISDSDADP